MSKTAVGSLLLSCASLVLVAISLSQTRTALARMEEMGQGGVPPAAGGGTAPVDNSAALRELEALRKELADLKNELLSIQAGVPLTRIDPEMVSKALDDLLKEREKESQIAHMKETEGILKKQSSPWIRSLAGRLKLTEEQTQKIEEVIGQQIQEGVKIRAEAEGDPEEQLYKLAVETDRKIMELLTDSQKPIYQQTNKNWHKGRLGGGD